MTETVVDRIASELGRRVIDSRLPPGTRLRQDAFALEFGASQVSVREALLRLEAQRLVVREPGKGARVVPLPPGGEREILAMRLALEVLALRSLTGRPSPRRLARIEVALDAGDRAGDAVEWEAANRDFHVSLSASAALPRLAASVLELNVASSRYALAQARPVQWEPRSNHDHRRIFEAVAAGDVDGAAALLQHHLTAGDRIRRP